MAWSWGKKGGNGRDNSWSTEQSSSKKRKVEEKSPDLKSNEQREVNKDDWDDDEEFTQNELAELDLIASQAICQPQAPIPAQTTKAPSEVSFVVPLSSARGAGSRSMSSSDSSIFPRSLSSRSTIETSVSLSSSNGKHDSPRETVHTKQQTKLDEEKKCAEEKKYWYDGEIKSLRERLHKQEEELEKLRAIRDEKVEQQQQIQTERLLKLQSQVEGLTSQVQFKEREFQSLQEKNSILQQKMKRLQQQSQAATGQAIVCLTQSQKSASPHKVPVQPSPPSKQKQQEMKELMGGEKSTFPTTLSFMEQTVSARSVSSAEPAALSVSCQTTGIPFATKPPQYRRLHLHARVSNATEMTTGTQVVSHLLQASDSEATFESKDVPDKAQWDPGLVSLLHDMSTSLKIAGLTFSRDKDSSCLSPLRAQRHGQEVRSSDGGLIDGTVQVVTRQNLQMAIEGLILLLDDDAANRSRRGQDSEMSIVTGVAKTIETSTRAGKTFDKSRTVECDKQSSHADVSFNVEFNPATSDGNRSSSSPSKQAHNSFTCRSGAAMLLPLLTDYIRHYVNLVHSTFKSASTPGQTSVVSPQSVDSFRSYAECSSCESSFDSLGSQLGQLLHEGQIYASCVEMYAVTALRCLVLLIELCPEVGDTIIVNHTSLTVSSTISLGNSTTSSSSNVGTETEQQSKRSSSSAGADDEHSTSSSEVRVIGEASNQSHYSLNGQFISNSVSSTLQNLIMKLAGQDLEDNQSNVEVVKLALNVLTCLCHCCTEENLPKLESVITRGILANCFRQTKHIPVLIWAQRLLVSLTKSEKMLARLCTKSENCPLYLMYRACSMNTDGVFDLCKEYVISLSNIISRHRSALRHLLSNTCPCAEELVMGVIMALYNLFSTYKTAGLQHKQEILNTLAQGVILIHSLAQGDGAFSQHHMAVQLQYVRLLSGVASIMRSYNQVWELQLSTLEELCDFDISDNSQDSEGEDKMDQS